MLCMFCIYHRISGIDYNCPDKIHRSTLNNHNNWKMCILCSSKHNLRRSFDRLEIVRHGMMCKYFSILCILCN